MASGHLFSRLYERFHRGPFESTGWWILQEPGIALPGALEIVPDLAGWRRERMPYLKPDEQIRVVPDWVCEIASPSTRRLDLVVKRPFYARAGVSWLWLLDPEWRSLAVSRQVDGRWVDEVTYADEGHVRGPPFEELELDLESLWPFGPGVLTAHDSEQD